MIFYRATLLLLSALSFSSVHAEVTDYFNQIKKEPHALYTFLKKMPKGGELHYHLAGGSYPETMLALASKGDYCINTDTLAITKNTLSCDGVKSNEVFAQPELFKRIIRSWSMKDFVPGKESAHDHFFNGFIKYIPIVFDYRPFLLADIIQRAAQQQEQYLEIMAIPDNARSADFGDLIKGNTSFTESKQTLLSNEEFKNNIAHTLQESDRVVLEAHHHLGCDRKNLKPAACNVEIKFLYYVLREQPLEKVFAQALNAFEVASHSQSHFVGVNLVQPEDGIISLRDYQQQMQIFEFLHHQYPEVHISLHAGELEQGAVAPEHLNSHIHDALLTGHAQRIGHGAAIEHEKEAENTLNYMAKNQLAVEINLISNKVILNLSGKNHPLNTYLAHHVPVVLATDDEGVLRTNLTRQYVEATSAQGLDYKTLKQINRNTLTYAFLPGKSLWANAETAELISDCQNLNSKSCLEFINDNQKAKLQWNLEQKLISFEKSF